MGPSPQSPLVSYARRDINLWYICTYHHLPSNFDPFQTPRDQRLWTTTFLALGLSGCPQTTKIFPILFNLTSFHINFYPQTCNKLRQTNREHNMRPVAPPWSLPLPHSWTPSSSSAPKPARAFSTSQRVPLVARTSACGPISHLHPSMSVHIHFLWHVEISEIFFFLSCILDSSSAVWSVLMGGSVRIMNPAYSSICIAHPFAVSRVGRLCSWF